jgi:hypothetical protein
MEAPVVTETLNPDLGGNEDAAWCGEAAMAAYHDRALARGYTLPVYRTAAEYEAAVARAAKALGPKRLPAPGSVALKLEPEEAATQFLAWLRLGISDRQRAFCDADLSAAYANFCAAANLAPLATSRLRAALLRKPGVSKETRDMRVDGKRRRVQVWTIKQPAPVARITRVA